MIRIVTLDGPAGVGKTTIAKHVAQHLGIAYLDTGAMFRIVGRMLGPEGFSLSEKDIAEKLAALEFSLSGSGDTTLLACNGRVAGQEIRTEQAGMLASRYGTLAPVRAYLKQAQQALGARYPLVAEGRDMGTAVFPEAPFKFFLDASAEVRAMRRVKQLAENGITEDLATITRQIRERDDQDRNRALAPLKPADDAIVIDTSNLSVDEVFAAIVAAIER